MTSAPRSRRLLQYAAVLILALAARSPGAANSGWSLVVEPLPSPAGPKSGQPQLSAAGEHLVASWIERVGANATLKFAMRNASGWTEPQKVASGDDWFVNWADVPSVIRLDDGTLAAHWLQKSGPDTYAYDVRLSFSTDGGRTWSPSVTPHHDGTQTEHGFASLFQMPGAGLGLIWLDGREMKAEDGGHGSGSMTVRAAIFDRSRTQQAEMLVDGRVCECCPTAVAITAEGPIAAFRDRSEHEIRDIYVSRYVNNAWTEPRAVHDDGWKIPACPVNGPALSARGRQVAIAWFTLQEEQGRAFAAFSADAGATFGAPLRLDDGGSLGRVDIELLDDGSAVASWIEFADQRAQFRARRVGPRGDRTPAVTVSSIESGRTSGYPRLARRGRELIFAWTETGENASQVRTAIARLDGGAATRD